jgi:Family of unknown function (DUF6519)
MIGDMYGDFSRLTFAPEKHFSAVLVQQGRVMLDADANEQTAVTLHYLRQLAADVIGPYGGIDGTDAFLISRDKESPATLLIGGPGRYYVHGLLCEVDEPTSYFEQPDAFLDPDDDKLPEGVAYVVYMKVWERHITALEDPSIRELALGENGPDTAARSKVVWQVHASRYWPPGSGVAVGKSTAALRKRWEDALGAGRTPGLRAHARQPSVDDYDPCVTSPEARYRGLENQLYRVEIHDGGNADPPTFKWSRDNGAAVFPLETLSDAEATVVSLGRDVGLGLEPGDWVEVLDDRSVLRGERRKLHRVGGIEPLDRLVSLEDATDDGVGDDPALHPFLRRWDQREGPENAGYAALDPDRGVLAVTEGEWIQLEDGIEIQFERGGDYTAGDYWLIPARTATGDVEWPQELGEAAFRGPTGIRYFYAPLAYVHKDGQVEEMRSTFRPLSKPL